MKMAKHKTAGANISQKALEIFREYLGEHDQRLPRGAKYYEFKQYLKDRYEHFPEGILFKHGTRHEVCSIDKGNSWLALAEGYDTQIRIVQKLDQAKVLLIQAQIGEQTLDPKQWVEEVKNLDLIENPRIYEPTEQGTYIGSILHKDAANRFCAQKTGSRAITLHDARKLPKELPEKGDFVQISYRDGMAEISLPQWFENTQIEDAAIKETMTETPDNTPK